MAFHNTDLNTNGNYFVFDCIYYAKAHVGVKW